MPKKQWKYDDPIKVVDAARWEAAIYNRTDAQGTGAVLIADLPDFVLEHGAALSIRIPADIENGATLSINGGEPIGLYTTNGVEVLKDTAAKGAWLTCTYDENTNRLYIDGISQVTGTTVVKSDVQHERFLGDGIKTKFEFVNGAYVMGQNRILSVFVGGSIQLFGDSYTESSTTSITFSEPPPFDSIILVTYIENFYGDNFVLVIDGENY